MGTKELWWDDGIDFRPRTKAEMRDILARQSRTLEKICKLDDEVQWDYKRLKSFVRFPLKILFSPIKFAFLIVNIQWKADKVKILSRFVWGE